jgi:hypothetical protein
MTHESMTRERELRPGFRSVYVQGSCSPVLLCFGSFLLYSEVTPAYRFHSASNLT